MPLTVLILHFKLFSVCNFTRRLFQNRNKSQIYANTFSILWQLQQSEFQNYCELGHLRMTMTQERVGGLAPCIRHRLHQCCSRGSSKEIRKADFMYTAWSWRTSCTLRHNEVFSFVVVVWSFLSRRCVILLEKTTGVQTLNGTASSDWGLVHNNQSLLHYLRALQGKHAPNSSSWT
jgi:hypothetical protein